MDTDERTMKNDMDLDRTTNNNQELSYLLSVLSVSIAFAGGNL